MSTIDGYLGKIEATAAVISILVTFLALRDFFQKNNPSPYGHYYGSVAASNLDKADLKLTLFIDKSGRVTGSLHGVKHGPIVEKIYGMSNNRAIMFFSYNTSNGTITRWNGTFDQGSVKGDFTISLPAALREKSRSYRLSYWKAQKL